MVSVSVVVPVYNSEAYLARCLESLVRQSLESIEILLVNDGSTDASANIMEGYRARYPGRVRVFCQSNRGQAAARNLGIQNSRGAYIGFVDSDDYVEPDMYEALYARAKADGSDYVECLYHCVEEGPKGARERPTRGRIRAYRDQKDMFLDPQVSPWNKLYRREVLLQPGLGFPEGFIYEDTAFFIKTIPSLRTTSFVNRRLVYYVLRDGSTMTANKSGRVGNIFPVLDDILAFYRRRGLFAEYRAELEYFCVKILLCSSLSRIGRVQDRALFHRLLDETFAWVGSRFPQYRQNPYFRAGTVGLYVKLVGRRNAALLARALARVMKG